MSLLFQNHLVPLFNYLILVTADVLLHLLHNYFHPLLTLIFYYHIFLNNFTAIVKAYTNHCFLHLLLTYHENTTTAIATIMLCYLNQKENLLERRHFHNQEEEIMLLVKPYNYCFENTLSTIILHNDHQYSYLHLKSHETLLQYKVTNRNC